MARGRRPGPASAHTTGGARWDAPRRARAPTGSRWYWGSAALMTHSVGARTAGGRATVAPPDNTRQMAQSAACAGTQLDVPCDSTCAKAPRSDAASARASATDANAGSRSWKMAVRIRPARWRRRRGIGRTLMTGVQLQQHRVDHCAVPGCFTSTTRWTLQQRTRALCGLVTDFPTCRKMQLRFHNSDAPVGMTRRAAGGRRVGNQKYRTPHGSALPGLGERKGWTRRTATVGAERRRLTAEDEIVRQCRTAFDC
jgi:hypothetical protein